MALLDAIRLTINRFSYFEVYDGLPNVIHRDLILARIRNRETVNLNNYIINGDINLTQLNIAHVNGMIPISTPIIITNSQILGELNFSNVRFSNTIDLRGSIVCGRTSFDGSIFNQPCHFNNAHFFGAVTLNRTEFNYIAVVDFSKAEFKLYTECLGARFPRSASFNECIFIGYVLFNGSTFTGISNFTGTIFKDRTDLGNQTQSTWFSGTKFCKEAYFQDVRLNIMLSSLRQNLKSRQLLKVLSFSNQQLLGKPYSKVKQSSAK